MNISKLSLNIASLLFLSSCGNSDNNNSNDVNSSTPNVSPVIAEIAELNVSERDPVTITSSASDSDGTISSYLWTQASGSTIELAKNDTSTLSFIAPELSATEVFTFDLLVTDNNGATATQSVTVNINAFDEINFSTFDNLGLLVQLT